MLNIAVFYLKITEILKN